MRVASSISRSSFGTSARNAITAPVSTPTPHDCRIPRIERMFYLNPATGPRQYPTQYLRCPDQSHGEAGVEVRDGLRLGVGACRKPAADVDAQ